VCRLAPGRGIDHDVDRLQSRPDMSLKKTPAGFDRAEAKTRIGARAAVIQWQNASFPSWTSRQPERAVTRTAVGILAFFWRS